MGEMHLTYNNIAIMKAAVETKEERDSEGRT